MISATSFFSLAWVIAIDSSRAVVAVVDNHHDSASKFYHSQLFPNKPRRKAPALTRLAFRAGYDGIIV